MHVWPAGWLPPAPPPPSSTKTCREGCKGHTVGLRIQNSKQVARAHTLQVWGGGEEMAIMEAAISRALSHAHILQVCGHVLTLTCAHQPLAIRALALSQPNMMQLCSKSTMQGARRTVGKLVGRNPPAGLWRQSSSAATATPTSCRSLANGVFFCYAAQCITSLRLAGLK